MFLVIIGIVLVIASIVIAKSLKASSTVPFSGLFKIGAVAGTFMLGMFMLANTSYVYVGADEVGHMKRIYMGSSLQNGRIIAANGENGYQAQILAPGFHIVPLISVIYDVEMLPIVEIPAGFYGRIETTDGKPLPSGAIMAREWPDDEFQGMLDAKTFLDKGGEKGLQTAVLKPGKYRLNLYLYKIRIAGGGREIIYSDTGRNVNTKSQLDTSVTVVPAGYVGVVKSNVTERGRSCVAEKVAAGAAEEEVIEGALSVPLVAKGCKGIWRDALLPAAYYMNRDAFQVTLVDTRVQTWQYMGGFTKRMVDLTVGQDGKLVQKERSEVIVYDPKIHADKAIFVKVEGWDVPLEVRAIVQVSPENAPIVVAAVGGLKEVENRVLTPALRSIVRNEVGGGRISDLDEEGNIIWRKVRVLDLIERRESLESIIEAKMKLEGRKAGVEIKEVRFGEPAIPPELLVARQREQLSTQLRAAFAQEKLAQVARIETEEARAKADQQGELVKAKIKAEAAAFYQEEQERKGNADKAYLISIAEGEKARAMVLGEDKVMMLNIVGQVLETLKTTPELLTGLNLPQTFVMGGGLEGFGAVFGAALGGGSKNTASAGTGTIK